MGDVMQTDECVTETLVLAQEDAQGALAAELAAKRPKEMAHRRLRAAVEKVKSRVLLNRAKARLPAQMRHPCHSNADGGGRLLRWPDWAQLKLDEPATGDAGGARGAQP